MRVFQAPGWVHDEEAEEEEEYVEQETDEPQADEPTVDLNDRRLRRLMQAQGTFVS